MSLGSPKKKAAQRFKKLFDLWMDESALQGERDSAKGKADAWLKQHQKSWRDASSILAQAAADDDAGHRRHRPPIHETVLLIHSKARNSPRSVWSRASSAST